MTWFVNEMKFNLVSMCGVFTLLQMCGISIAVINLTVSLWLVFKRNNAYLVSIFQILNILRR
jgi:uncharacterized membrane protein